jgi:thiamine pyrophosphokinase
MLLEKAVEQGVEVELIAGDETAWLIRGDFTLPVGRAGDRISLVPLSDEVVVRTDGLRYRLHDESLRRASAHGVSNAIDRLPVRIAVRSGTLLVVHGPPQESVEQ